MEEINLFFNFLHFHIKDSGYSQILKKYQLTPLERELYKMNRYGEFEREPEIYYKPDLVSTLLEHSEELLSNNEELTDIVFINPQRQYIITKTYDNSSKKKLINESFLYLYLDLQKLYAVKFGEFKDFYGKFLMECDTYIKRVQFEEGLIIRLNNYIRLVDEKFYLVYSPKGEVINLLLNFLQQILDWITRHNSQISNKVNDESDVTISDGINLDNINNKFNGMPLAMVREHFKTLLSKSKNGQPHLSNEKFNIFFDTIFIKGKTLEGSKIEMNLGRGERKIITSIFYQFYSKSINSMTIEGNTQTKDKYVKLLTDNFLNFEYVKVNNNFR